MVVENDSDSLERLWDIAAAAAEKGDFAGALFALRALADKGQWTACARIGELYETAPAGIERDIQQALKWYRMGIYYIDDPIAHLGLGRILIAGLNEQKNQEIAKVHFEKAFANSEFEAGIYLGLIYLGHNKLQCAKRYFEVAATAGYCLSHAALARIAFRERRFLEALRQIKSLLFNTIRIYQCDSRDRRLIGVFGNNRTDHD